MATARSARYGREHGREHEREHEREHKREQVVNVNTNMDVNMNTNNVHVDIIGVLGDDTSPKSHRLSHTKLLSKSE